MSLSYINAKTPIYQTVSKKWAAIYVNDVIKKYNPKFEIKYKKDSKLFKFLKPLLLLLNPEFFSYYTTMFGKLWVPDDFYDRTIEEVLRVLAHEGVHEHDRKKMLPGAFGLSYLFPQILAVPFLFLAIFHSWWWMIAFAAFLAPLPAYFRFKTEMKAYGINKIWTQFVYGLSADFFDEDVVYEMASVRTYYLAWPFRNHIRKQLEKPLDLTEPAYQDIIKFLRVRKIVNL